ncbi:MAG: hypothetical protein IJU96_11115 [Clostridia bacterium]|nr:hypothetical protein [Clostridia bacterium]
MKRFSFPRFLRSLPFWCGVAAGAAVLLRPQAATDGVKNGLALCGGVVIPSLFPFLAVSSFCAQTKTPKILGSLTRALFRLPPCAAPAVLFGLLGGYPVGCKTAAQLEQNGLITKEQAQRCTLFCVNAGPAFAITAVGGMMLRQRRLGLLLFASLTVAALMMGILLRFTAAPIADAAPLPSAAVSPANALVRACETAAKAMFGICGWVMLFSCFHALLLDCGLPVGLKSALLCLTEVTAGCAYAAQHANLYTVAALLAWSGVCVVCQVLPQLKQVGTPPLLFLCFRAAHAALTCAVLWVLLRLFPTDCAVFSTFTGQAAAQSFSFSAPAAVALLGLCIVFLFDLERGNAEPIGFRLKK